MSIKFGAVITYRDIEEAKKLIGKKVICGNYFRFISEVEKVTKKEIRTLLGVSDSAEPFITENVNRCQFIREVIEELQYRPFTPEELAEQVGKVVRYKNTDTRVMITIFEDGRLNIARNPHAYTGEEFLEHFEFLDGKPCGVEVEV